MANFWRSREANAISSYWNAVTDGQPTPERAAHEIDSTLLDTIARIQEGRERYVPDPDFVNRLETTLMNTTVIANAIPPALPRRTVTKPAWLPERELLFPRKWSLAAVATVALIAITLAIFFFSLRGTDQPAVVPATPVDAPTSTPAPAPTATVEPVSMYRGGLERTGVMPGPAPSGRPGVLWRAETGSVVKGPVVVGNGLVYTGTDDGSVHAFDMSTGAEVWMLTGNTTFESPSIVLDGSTAYVAGYDGMVLAVDASTGAELWRTDPALNVGRRVAFDAASQTLYVGGLEPVSYAFDSATGQLKWQVEIGGQQNSVSSVVAGNTLYFGASDALLYALNTADGSARWTWDSTFDPVGSLTYANDTIFGPAGSNFVAIDASTGVERWRISSTGATHSAAAVVDGNVIFGTDLGEVISASQADGAVNWTFATGNDSDTAGFGGPPGIVGDTVYAVDTDGSLYALDLATGQELWRVTLDGGINYNPAITGGVMYLGTWAGSVYALGDGGSELPVATPVAMPATPSAATPAPETSPGIADSPVTLLWETEGTGNGLPWQVGLTIAPDGNLWHTDGANSRFLIYSPDGELLETWGTEGSEEGQFLLRDATGAGYCRIVFNADGSFLVLDFGNYRIQAFDKDRNFLRAWGSRGQEDGRFVQMVGIDIDANGVVYVLDGIRGVVQKFDQTGVWLETVTLAGEFSGPNTLNPITLDPDGNMFIGMLGDGIRSYNQFVKYDPQGNVLMIVRPESESAKFPGQVNNIALDAAGNSFVTSEHSVFVFSPEGDYLTSFRLADLSGLGLGDSVAIDDAGHLYVADGQTMRLAKFQINPPLRPLEQAASPSPATVEAKVELLWETSGGPNPLGFTVNLAIAPDGNIWVADGPHSQFQIFSPDGEYLESWGTPGDGDGEFNFTRTDSDGESFGAIAFAPDGSFYVADVGHHRVHHFSPTREFLGAWGEPGTGSGKFNSAIGVAVDSAGNVYVNDDRANVIQKFSADGDWLVTIGGLGRGPGQFSGQWLMTIDVNDNLWVADPDNSRIQLFDSSGTFVKEIDTAGKVVLPASVAVDKDGRKYVVDFDRRQIVVLDANDEVVAGWAWPTALNLESAINLVLDEAGHAYVADFYAGRLLKLRLPQSLAPATPTP